jgi:hypothetical protein
VSVPDDGKFINGAHSVTQKVYRGFVVVGDYGENIDALGLEATRCTAQYPALSDEPLAMVLEDDRDRYGPYASVRYFVTDEERTVEELTENLVQTMAGALNARYHDAYSEVTGYLWTDQDIKVGGHDLLAELETFKDRFVHLEIEWSESSTTADRSIFDHTNNREDQA